MRYTLYAGSYFGIPVRIHFTFPLILAVFGVDAWLDGGWTEAVWALLLILAVFVCVVLHEFGHSLQVMRYGIRVRDIVLLPIGGMARAERIPENPRQEIIVAISGPLVNFGLAAILFGVMWISGTPMAPENGFLANLFAINILLGVFNLVPAYPMDGGRILRALLAFKFSYLRATRHAKNVGQVIALAFVVIGFVYHELIMLPVIAVFIYFGAISEENMIRVRWAFGGKRARDFVQPGQRVLTLTDPISSAAVLFVPGSPAALAVTDERRTMFGVIKARDVADALEKGKSAEPLSSIAEFDIPVVNADMPAKQAYYVLKAEKRSVAGVIDTNQFAGLLHLSSFESLLKTAR
ncbi:MAG: site-2 protease family protein [Candidatus Krumholzibacteria bacterium]|nr:site-2 protease family protein [Candidatus Krumholzibacteria bacterium]